MHLSRPLILFASPHLPQAPFTAPPVSNGYVSIISASDQLCSLSPPADENMGRGFQRTTATLMVTTSRLSLIVNFPGCLNER